MIASLLGETKVVLTGSNANVSILTIVAVGVSGATAVALRQTMPAEWNLLPFDDGPSFLAFTRQTPVDCAVTEVRRPGLSALALHQEWSERDPWATTVLLAECARPDDLSRCFPRGAVRLLRKPWEPNALRRTIDEAQRQGAAKRASVLRRRRSTELLRRLNRPERLVVERLYEGLPHKCIAAKLGVSRRTVDYRRNCAFQKLGVKNLAELVRIVAEIELAEAIYGQC